MSHNVTRDETCPVKRSASSLRLQHDILLHQSATVGTKWSKVDGEDCGANRKTKCTVYTYVYGIPVACRAFGIAATEQAEALTKQSWFCNSMLVDLRAPTSSCSVLMAPCTTDLSLSTDLSTQTQQDIIS